MFERPEPYKKFTKPCLNLQEPFSTKLNLTESSRRYKIQLKSDSIMTTLKGFLNNPPDIPMSTSWLIR
jgi:hypothetical protein